MSLTASTCGTFAWFTYATRAYAYYHGVSIGSGTLQLGFLSEVSLDDYLDYGLEKETVDNKDIYWVDGDADASTINYVLAKNGYATNSLVPVTSGSYASGDEFSLYQAPKHNQKQDENKALKNTYLSLSLVFRYIDDIDLVAIPDIDIYLSRADLRSETNIDKAVRIFTTSDEDHLICPAVENDGEINVGGNLDLDGDGYYDHYTDEEGKQYEVAYGEFEHLQYEDSPSGGSENVNENERTTFLANHALGVYPLDESNSLSKVAQFEGITKFKRRSQAITKTNSLTQNYAYVDITIFVEGWDLSVIDEEKGSMFALDLEFGVNV